MTPIESADELAELMDQLAWWQDTLCRTLAPPPGAGTLPEQVELVVRDEGTGGFDPGDVRTHRETRLIATGIREWSFTGERFEFDPDSWMDGAELIDGPDGFGLTFDVPTPVRLVATAFAYERLPDHHEVMPAWTSDNRLTLTAPHAEPPAPHAWLEAFAREGAEVTWRMYGGPAVAAERVSADYTGYFLERPERLTEHTGGLLMFHIGREAEELQLSVERKGADDELWRAFCRVVARLFPSGKIHSGNLRFTAD